MSTTTTIIPSALILREQQFLAADLGESFQIKEAAKKEQFKAGIVWRNVALFVVLHAGALTGLWQLLFMAKWQTIGWCVFLWVAGGMGITAGAHRLWAHRSYKARFPLRLLLVCLNCVAFQNGPTQILHHRVVQGPSLPPQMDRHRC